MNKWNSKELIEALGILALVGSLVFVGLELRQNSAIARTAAYDNYVQGFSDYNLMIATDDDLTSIYVKVRNGETREDFTPEEAAKLYRTYIALVRQSEGVYRSVQEGILPLEVLDTIGALGGFQSPAFIDSWTTLQFGFTQDFIDFMNSRIN